MTDLESPITLVCLPFAGAGASFYRPWTGLTDALEVVPLQLPGRERRIDEDPHRAVRDAVPDLSAELRAQLDGPARVVLFGHSLGAVLAYELAHLLVSTPGIELVRLCASGSPEPHTQRQERATGMSDADFLRQVRRFAGYSHEALEDPEMRELILPALRADVEMHESYEPSTSDPLPAPITALRGDTDELVSADEAAAWARVTTRDFEFVQLPGGHMYLTDAVPELLRRIEETLGSGSVG